MIQALDSFPEIFDGVTFDDFRYAYGSGTLIKLNVFLSVVTIHSWLRSAATFFGYLRKG